MKTRTMFCLAIIAALALCLAVSQPAIASDEDDALKVMENFAKAFNTSDQELMFSLHLESTNLSKYAPSKNGAFLAQGWEAISEGWKSGGNFETPSGTFATTVHNPEVTFLGDNVAIVCGYLNMTVNPPAAVEQTVNLIRQTLVVQKTGGKWLIVHEHSSMLPTE